jgi:hypothetical protein
VTLLGLPFLDAALGGTAAVITAVVFVAALIRPERY